MSTTWQPFYVGHKLATLTELEGISIPDPDALQGWLAYVVNVPAPINGPAYYSLSLTSGLPFDPIDVRPTILGGATRWLRMVMQAPPPIGGLPTTIEPDDAPDPGLSPSAARSDHRHGIIADTPGVIEPDDVPAEGVSTAFARADHQHGIATDIAGVIEPDDAPAEGVSTAFARADHQHGIAADVPVPVGLVLAEGVSTAFARADHVHTLGDDARSGLASVLTWGAGNVVASTTTRYLAPGFEDGLARTTPLEYRVPRAGTFEHLYVHVGTPGGGVAIVAYTLQVNGVPTLLSAAMAAAASDASELVQTVAVAEGDLVAIRVTKAGAIMGAPMDVVCSLRFRGV